VVRVMVDEGTDDAPTAVANRGGGVSGRAPKLKLRVRLRLRGDGVLSV
jgi:hypothetical protein